MTAGPETTTATLRWPLALKLNNSLVGAEGFEPPTLCSQSRCATRLRHAPTRTADGVVRSHRNSFAPPRLRASAPAVNRVTLTGIRIAPAVRECAPVFLSGRQRMAARL